MDNNTNYTWEIFYTDYEHTSFTLVAPDPGTAVRLAIHSLARTFDIDPADVNLAAVGFARRCLGPTTDPATTVADIDLLFD